MRREERRIKKDWNDSIGESAPMSRKVDCPVCKKDETIKLFGKQGCTFVQCTNDGLAYIHPQPGPKKLQEVYDTYGREFFLSLDR